MAHRIKIEVKPHRNKGHGKQVEGPLSATKKDYVVVDRHRGKRVVVGVASSPKEAAQIITEHRQLVMAKHLMNHPNDQAFKAKHKIESKVISHV
jgi:hypothetical protein